MTAKIMTVSDVGYCDECGGPPVNPATGRAHNPEAPMVALDLGRGAITSVKLCLQCAARVGDALAALGGR